MSSTYTTANGIELINTGEQSGAWGDTTNTNLQIVDRVLTGIGSITLSGTAHTLTTTYGTLSEGMYRVLVLGGSPSGTNTITVAPNDAQKTYMVYNNSGESAIFTQGSGANVTVANGDAKLIYMDGAGTGAAVFDFTANLAMSSVNITGGTIDGTVIGGTTPAAVTGTAITGTSFTTTGDMSFGDNDKAIFGAGSDLEIFHNGSDASIRNQTGDLYIRSQSDDKKIFIQTDNGSGGVATYITADGVSGQVILTNYGNTKLATTATGISVTGTITSDGLTVGGDIHVLDDVVTLALESSNTNGQKWSISSTYTNTGGSYGALIIEDEAGSDWLRFDEGNGSPFSQFLVNGSEAMRIDASGNVGIGTSSPDQALHVEKSVAGGGTELLVVNSGANQSGTYSQIGLGTGGDSTGTAYFRLYRDGSGVSELKGYQAQTFLVNNAERMRIDSSGNIGIGTSSPATNLHIKIPSVASTSTEVFRVSDDVLCDFKLFLNRGTTLANSVSAVNTAAGIMAFETSNAERMRIDSSGNFGIGTSSPSSLATIQGTSSGQNVLQLSNSAGSSDGGAENGLRVTCNGNTNWGNLNVQAYQTIFSQNGSERMRIDASGNVGIGTSSPTAGLHIDNPSNGAITAILDTDNSAVKMVFRNNTETGNNLQLGADGSDLVAFTGGSERMRIDSSGNVLVGTTSLAVFADTNDGVMMEPAGAVVASRNSNTVGYFRRRGTDGDIFTFLKDTTAVGSIGVAQSGDRTYFAGGSYGIASDTSDATIMPCDTTGGGNDGVLSLGKSDARFKDAYLSGGVYLGGTAAANKLDDYEEGTWTPTLAGSTTAGTPAYDSQTASYTKVGNMVHVQGRVGITALNGMAGSTVNLGNLPFTAEGTGNNYSIVSFGYADGLSMTAGQTLTGHIQIGGNFFFLKVWDAAAGTSNFGVSELSATGDLIFSASYRTA